jgi:hypothetical protein
MKFVHRIINRLCHRRGAAIPVAKRPPYVVWLSQRRACAASYVPDCALTLFFGTSAAAVIVRGPHGFQIATSHAGRHEVLSADVITLYGALLYSLADTDYCLDCLQKFLGVEPVGATADRCQMEMPMASEEIVGLIDNRLEHFVYWHFNWSPRKIVDFFLAGELAEQTRIDYAKAVLTIDPMARDIIGDHTDLNPEDVIEILDEDADRTQHVRSCALRALDTYLLTRAEELQKEKTGAWTTWEFLISGVNRLGYRFGHRDIEDIARRLLRLIKPETRRAAYAAILATEPEAQAAANGHLFRAEDEAIDVENKRHAWALSNIATQMLTRYGELDRIEPDDDEEEAQLKKRVTRAVTEGDIFTLGRELCHEWPAAKSTQIGDLLSALMTDEQRAVYIADGSHCWEMADDIATDVQGHRDHLHERELAGA